MSNELADDKRARRPEIASSELTADVIIKLLEEPTEHRYPIKLRITEEATATKFVQALQQATQQLTRQILCDIAGERLEKDAVPALLQYLQAPSIGVRASAGDALGKIGNPGAGPVLYERFAGVEQSDAVLTTLALALGSTRYKPAIPLLIEALKDEADVIRGCSAWALGLMCAVEAEDAIRSAFLHEPDPVNGFLVYRYREAIAALDFAMIATTRMIRKEATRQLLDALKIKPPVAVRITSALWALGKLKAMEAVKPLKQLLVEYPKGFMAEHIQAALVAIQSDEG